MDYGFLPLLILLVYLYFSVRVASENERFAVFVFGRFVGFKGPGIMLKMPGGSSTFVRVKLGTNGEIQSSELASFEGNVMPYKASTPVRAGSKVRVTGFEKAAVQVEAVQQFVVCEKCGHKNAV